jgi:hypothetical protein
MNKYIFIPLCTLAILFSSILYSQEKKSDQFYEIKKDTISIPNLNLNTTDFYNTFKGANALMMFRTKTNPNPTDYGSNNSAFGGNALLFNTKGGGNTAIGVNALMSNISGEFNVAIGFGALKDNTSDRNTAIGSFVLEKNTTGDANIGIGYLALTYNTTGSENVGIGNCALAYNITGSENVAIGSHALYKNQIGERNVAIGENALRNNIGNIEPKVKGTINYGFSNTAIGWSALKENTTGLQNTAVGESALMMNLTGNHNTGIGEDALFNTNSDNNTAIGESALYDNISGTDNVALGRYALNHSKGNRNIGIGAQSGCNAVLGSGNIFIGNVGFPTDTNVIRIGGATYKCPKCPDEVTLPKQNKTFIAGIYNSEIGSDEKKVVYITPLGQLGIGSKTPGQLVNIKPLNANTNKLMKLTPISYNYKSKNNKNKPLQYGLKMEDIVKEFPELAHYNEEGKPYAVNYDFLSSLMLKMLQEEHENIQQLKEMIMSLKKQNDSLVKIINEMKSK